MTAVDARYGFATWRRQHIVCRLALEACVQGHNLPQCRLQAMRLGRVRVGMTAAFKSSRVPVIEDDVLSVVGCRVLGDVTVGRSTQPIYSLKSGLRRRGSGTLRTSTSILTPTFEIACRGGCESWVTKKAQAPG